MIRAMTIGVIGAGAWGTALAQAASRAGRQVVLFARDPERARMIERTRRNPPYLADLSLDPAVRASADLGAAAAADALLLAVPAQALRALAPTLPAGAVPLVVCAKGFETATGARLSQVLASERPGSPVAVLSGPNFAREVALGLPAAATLGAADGALGQRLALAVSSASFRLYWTDDVTGVEVGGAVKNVLAIAAGIVAGRGLGENARAALITRGLAELARLGAALGARRETLMGLAGLGDLILTAGSLTSRNMAFGHAVGRGADPVVLQAHPGALVEGAHTAAAVMRLAERHAVEVPICAAVDAILAGRLEIAAALEALMSRPIRMEAER